MQPAVLGKLLLRIHAPPCPSRLSQAEGLGCLQAVTHYNDAKVLAEVSSGLGEAMVGIDCRTSNFYSYAARSE